MKGISSVNFAGKKVLVRVDFNVPVDENKKITDDTRIQEAMPTIKKLMSDGASIILMAHFGRPKKGGFEPELSLKPVVDYLSELLNQKVAFTQSLDFNDIKELADNLKQGEVMMIENIRFYPEETKGDVELAKKLASLGDCYVNDAFGAAHREHSSTATIAQFFPNDKYFGLLMEHEIVNLTKLMNAPTKPFTAIIGGSKISSKIDVIKNLLPLVDNLIIGGGMSYTFAKANGKNIGKSICEDDKIQVALDLQEEAKKQNVNLYLPVDILAGDAFSNDCNIKYCPEVNIPDELEGMDAGEKTRELFGKVILDSKTILWNGPVGVFEFENFAGGTNSIAKYIAEATDKGAFAAVGGGDSVSAIKKSGFADKISYISTGGGAMLEYLEGKTLPGIKAILD
ncbi:MAG: phosphoglycerate kinase [Bacteroidales bacterium]|jgi:phosphoglycerate kinase|nr:phosphoglycerate kinase [Bacteroidales bacterium]MBQ1190985.1 phosphoglycerate kinase [Bacteroidales bacterium]MBQ2303466.1 phosphoglycerate kinase [Bacteroidales bacterium]MBQ2386842.1 phosphoglycerate kinase [Bacteroidales bacterium]MEE0917363.1 phosphoglycerate kinase [Bacteroidales bacterium]